MTRLIRPLLAVSGAAILAACSQPDTAGSDGSQAAESSAMSAAPNPGEMERGEMMQDHMDDADMNGAMMQEGAGDDAMDHGAMMQGGMAAAEASAQGVLNAIDRDAGLVNITHPPMPEIGWPEMAMDIPVTGMVDLSGFNEGDTVRFTVRRGRDDVFRIVEMTPAGAGE